MVRFVGLYCVIALQCTAQKHNKIKERVQVDIYSPSVP